MRLLGSPLRPVFAGLIAVVPAAAQPPGHGQHPPMPDQKLYLHCRLGSGDDATSIEVPVELRSAAMPAELDQLVKLPAPLPPIHLERYLPQARLEQNVVPDGSGAGPPAVLVSIEGPTQSYQRWLIADDPLRNRLVSYVGTWRYMTVKDQRQREELFAQFEHELTREPRLVITSAEDHASVEVPAHPGTPHALEQSGCSVRVLKFYPHFGLDSKTKQAVNRSDQRVNPAALVEVDCQGRRQEEWVFAKFPGFSMGEKSALPIRIALDCPQESSGATPGFTLVTIGRARHEVWTRQAGEARARPLSQDDRIEITGSQYAFRAAGYVPSGLLEEAYHPTTGRAGVSALQARTLSASGEQETLWLELGKARLVGTASGPIMVVFGPRQSGAMGGHQ
ncbi:MAG TPA: hypothetical protein VM243_08205 [Phycisphaerae bacterium]|nr:hypothetical protein [Phycisphaerae bacterium]